jgi:hypothetical protein
MQTIRQIVIADDWSAAYLDLQLYVLRRRAPSSFGFAGEFFPQPVILYGQEK